MGLDKKFKQKCGKRATLSLIAMKFKLADKKFISQLVLLILTAIAQ